MVDVDFDARVRAGVRTGEAHRRGLRGPATSNLELGTLHLQVKPGELYAKTTLQRRWNLHRAARRGRMTRHAGLESCVNKRHARLPRYKLHTDDLDAKQVLAGLDATRKGEGDLALVLDEAVDGPRLRGRRQAVLVDLEPLEPGDRTLRRVGDLRTGRAREST